MSYSQNGNIFFIMGCLMQIIYKYSKIENNAGQCGYFPVFHRIS